MSLALALKGIKTSDYPDQFLDALGLRDEDRSATGYPAGDVQPPGLRCARSFSAATQ